VSAAPCACRRRAVASPSPEAPPTTSAPLPSMSMARHPRGGHPHPGPPGGPLPRGHARGESATTMLAFALASLALMAIPGPDMALIMRNAVVHGRRTGLATMLGGLAGISVHATASVVGLSALLAASATAFAVVKLVGAVYLTLLG